MPRRSSRTRRYFARLRQRFGKSIRRLCCFFSDTEDNGGVNRSNALTVEALKMFHATDMNDTFSDSTSMWSSEDGLQCITYYPTSNSKPNESDDDDDRSTASDYYHLANEGFIEIYNEDQDNDDSVLSDTTSSLIRFMDEMDNDSLADIFSVSTDNEDDDDTFTIVSDLTNYTNDLFDDDISDIVDDAWLATTLLDELIADVTSRMHSTK